MGTDINTQQVVMPHIILLIQNDPTDAQTVQDALLCTNDGSLRVEWVRRCSEGLERLTRVEGPEEQGTGRIAATLIDLFLPDSQGIETFDRVFLAAPQVPVLILSAAQHEDAAKLAVQHGVQDYLLKTALDGYILPGALARMVHAELERIANHLDVAMRLADAAGLAVATARFALHKERVLRLVSQLCGSRFGRGVVVPGGVAAFPQERPDPLLTAIGKLERQVIADAEMLMGTSSFLDRLRGTGPLLPDRAREHGAVGPIGKASGYADDARVARPYDAYPLLDAGPVGEHIAGDAMARLRVRFEEVAQAFRLIKQALSDFPERTRLTLQAPCEPTDGRAVGWAEAPQGEVLYDVTIEEGRISRCQPRSASFHNLVLMHEVFAGDILTDFPFIEASFGLSVAGAAL